MPRPRFDREGVRVIDRIEMVVEIMRQTLMLALGSRSADGEKTAGGGSLRQAILDALAKEGRPLKATVLARRTGRSNSGYFRGVLRGLVDDGLVVRCPDAAYGLSQNKDGQP